MDVLDEKVNGGPSMEVDDVVSVRDRESYPILYETALNVVVPQPR